MPMGPATRGGAELGMNGRELAVRLAPLCPGAKVIFMSGDMDEAIERHGVLDAELLRKPFDWNTPTERIGEALDQPSD